MDNSKTSCKGEMVYDFLCHRLYGNNKNVCMNMVGKLQKLKLISLVIINKWPNIIRDTYKVRQTLI